MIQLNFGFGPLEHEMWRVVFLMTRIGAALFAAPFFGATMVPVMARVSLAGALAIFLANWMPDIATPDALLSLNGLMAVAGEVLVGLALGFVLQLAFAAPTVAAELIGGGMGMSMLVTRDAMGGGTTTAFGQYFMIVLTLIFLATGAHLHWLALLAESYRIFPPGHTWLGPDRFMEIAGFGSTMFETAVRIALPVTLVLLLVQVLTGILSRSAPSLNLFALGLPAGVLAGIAALIVSAPILFDQFSDVVNGSLDQLTGVMAQ
ncbi:MAG: flagellar biosynthetic protein FliR [Sphingomonadaceae bacterium]